ncbi:MAG: glutamine--tRNA ligase/YqeY domain fusion protein [Planctomycetaceae bacterium]|nr:glutamine--tRNA ligase/YqeY domain fusion protein [Planctomycetaceae bacterium]
MNDQESGSVDFVRQKVETDNASGKFDGRVVTRFPPEPNGFLHIGHAKSICLNFGIAEEYGGVCHLRMDDTDPTKEDVNFVQAIQDDIDWLGFKWHGEVRYASDYFDQLHDWAVQLITAGKAYVDSQTIEEIRQGRGTLTELGIDSPYRERTVEENLELFARMRAGEFADGEQVLRAKIDMESKHLIMRDPIMYRIRHAEHYRQGDDWCVYPMYDFTHGQSDSIEGVTHSICTLEFENNRRLYDWYIRELGIYVPEQTEFARLGLTHTVMSKRRLLQLVNDGLVSGWDDPRMPTIRGLRRRGYTPEAIREFCRRIGVTKFDGVTEIALLEHCLRDDLNRRSQRRMAVLKPLKVVIENYPEGEMEELEAINNPEDESAGTRSVPFTRELFIERDDFLEDPPKKFYRLAPGREVRFRYAYFVTCRDVVKDDSGEVIDLRCTYDPQTRGGSAPDGRKVKSTIHWVSAEQAVTAEVRLYDHLFLESDPATIAADEEWTRHLNPGSLETLQGCCLERSLGETDVGDRFQFERLGYFCVDDDSTSDRPVFNRTVTLRDQWAKLKKQSPTAG